MKKELLFDLKSPYRNNFQIHGFRFGEGKKTVAIVGAMRGDEIQQQFMCSQLVKNLIDIEEKGLIRKGVEILVIPSVNHFSMNINKRFWAMDNTDINRMFPGYGKGETTQRIAAAIFEIIKGYKYGIHLASFYMRGEFIPHVRMMNTGYQKLETAKSFGLPYVSIREPKAYDTTLLNYNWQIFGTQAYTVYSSDTDTINKDSAKTVWKSILRFMDKSRIIRYRMHDGYASSVISEKDMHAVKSTRGGILYLRQHANDEVREGDLLAEILDPYDGSTLSEITAPVSGVIFFALQSPLVSQNTVIYRMVKYM
ncbi:MAG: succinylglutamate desuccinylase/aspartoacylase family protein [Tannerella sp.]|jgi:predicted deacylase|nr:succinylglutamate desuccinylase/aspartoacylase family protein [Tannerella sp.]